MFEEARALELDERLRSETRGVHSAGALLEMATANGHRSLGWGGPTGAGSNEHRKAGRIVPAARADLVTISLSSVRTAGANADSLIETAVFGATAADVTSVIVDGRRVVEAGQHCSIDVVAELDTSIREVMDQ